MKSKFKKGVASFYIVAIAALVLMVVATSFVGVIVSEVTRTSNDDLSQSAYDSALAGVESAKVAFQKYQDCKSGKATEGCTEIIEIMENYSGECNGINKILGNKEDTGEVSVGGENNMQQFYTCVKINSMVQSYTSVVSVANALNVAEIHFKDETEASNVKTMKISWYKQSDGSGSSLPSNFSNKGIFGSQASIPPVIYVAMVQTGKTFKFEDFNVTQGDQTNRGMIYLVPADGPVSDNKKYVNVTTNNNHITNYDENGERSGFLKSNDKMAVNRPFVVNCGNGANSDGYVCSATIDIPKPIGGGTRNNNTFTIAVGLPYGAPAMEYKLEFCGNGECMGAKEGGFTNGSIMNLYNTQIEIDSTGRANDLYRRVSAKLEYKDDYSISLLGPLELIGDDDDDSGGLQKTVSDITQEWNFSDIGR